MITLTATDVVIAVVTIAAAVIFAGYLGLLVGEIRGFERGAYEEEQR